jgi:hypothetical protein
MMATPQQIEANRNNSQFSTGAKTPEGKRKSSLNSVKHGFTGQSVLLNDDEVEPYRNFTEGTVKDFAPVGQRETHLAHSIADARWRLAQISITEAALYAFGLRRHADKFLDETPEMRISLCRAITFIECRKDLDRLRRYESALHRQAKADLAELTTLQAERKALDAAQKKEAVALHAHFSKLKQPWNPADFGFVLSIGEIEALTVRSLELAAASSAPEKAKVAAVGHE